MDITLERILSLLPKKPNGKFEHGALKELGKSVGFADGHIVNEWISGKSRSYRNYLYQISEKYNVSVEWLKCETDIKNEPTPISGKEFLSLASTLYCELSDLDYGQLLQVKAFVAGLKANQE